MGRGGGGEGGLLHPVRSACLYCRPISRVFRSARPVEIREVGSEGGGRRGAGRLPGLCSSSPVVREAAETRDILAAAAGVTALARLATRRAEGPRFAKKALTPFHEGKE